MSRLFIAGIVLAKFLMIANIFLAPTLLSAMGIGVAVVVMSLITSKLCTRKLPDCNLARGYRRAKSYVFQSMAVLVVPAIMVKLVIMGESPLMALVCFFFAVWWVYIYGQALEWVGYWIRTGKEQAARDAQRKAEPSPEKPAQ